MVDAGHFERHAATYAAARPPYPQALWDHLRDRGLLRPGAHALDLGAGTGQATGPLLAAGLRVTAVEPGPRLAAQLAAAHPDAALVRARAEDLQLPPASVDLVVVATAIHWLDLDAVLPAVHRFLTPDGRLLVWRNVFGDAAAPVTPFRERVAAVVGARTRPPRPGPDAENLPATVHELLRTRCFDVDHTRTWRWQIELDEPQVRRLFDTFSDWSGDEVDQVAAAVSDLGGRVVEHYTSWLVVLSRTPGP